MQEQRPLDSKEDRDPHIPHPAAQNEEAKDMSDNFDRMDISELQDYIRTHFHTIDQNNEDMVMKAAIADNILIGKQQEEIARQKEKEEVSKAIAAVETHIQEELEKIGNTTKERITAAQNLIEHILSIQPTRNEVQNIGYALLTIQEEKEDSILDRNRFATNAFKQATGSLCELIQISTLVRTEEISKRVSAFSALEINFTAISTSNNVKSLYSAVSQCPFAALKNELAKVDAYLSELSEARLQKAQEEKARISKRLRDEKNSKHAAIQEKSLALCSLFENHQELSAQLQTENAAVFAEVDQQSFHSDKLRLLNIRIHKLEDRISTQTKINEKLQGDATILGQKIKLAQENTNLFIDETLASLGLEKETVPGVTISGSSEEKIIAMEIVLLSKKLKSDLAIKENTQTALDIHLEAYEKLEAIVPAIQATISKTKTVLKLLARGKHESIEELNEYTKNLRSMAIQSLLIRDLFPIESVYTLVSSLLQHRVSANPILEKEQDADQKLVALSALNIKQAKLREEEFSKIVSDAFSKSNGDKSAYGNKLTSFIKTLDSDLASANALAKKAAQDKDKQEKAVRDKQQALDKIADKERQKAAAESTKQLEKQRLEKERVDKAVREQEIAAEKRAKAAEAEMKRQQDLLVQKAAEAKAAEAAETAKVHAQIDKATKEAEQVEKARLAKEEKAKADAMKREEAILAAKQKVEEEKGTSLSERSKSSFNNTPNEKDVIKKARELAKVRLASLEAKAKVEGATAARINYLDALENKDLQTNGYTTSDLLAAKSELALAASSLYSRSAGMKKPQENEDDHDLDKSDDNTPGMFN
ncbi:MAG: hypothetical protein ABI597_08925 [Gammaproteobacteria bacterium]